MWFEPLLDGYLSTQSLLIWRIPFCGLNFLDGYLSRRIIVNLEFHFAKLRFCLPGTSFSGFYLFRRIYVNKIIVNLGFNFVNLRFCLDTSDLIFWFLTSQTDICQHQQDRWKSRIPFCCWETFQMSRRSDRLERSVPF